MIMDLKQTCVLYIVDFMHVLIYDAKLRIIQSYEQVLVPMGSDKRGPTVHSLAGVAFLHGLTMISHL